MDGFNTISSILSESQWKEHLKNVAAVAKNRLSARMPDSVRIYLKKINDDADIYTPVGASGWRNSDVDTLKRVDDVRVQNVILSRMQASSQAGTIDTSSLSDEQIASLALPRNLNMSDMALLQEQIDSYVPLTSEPTPVPASEPTPVSAPEPTV